MKKCIVKFFFNTSSYFNLYHQEANTQKLVDLLNPYSNYDIYLSEIALVEIYSAIYKKVRTKELSDSQAHDFIEVVKNDLNNISIIIIDKLIINNPQKLLSKYGKIGLRTLDAIQLASIISVKSIIDAAFTNDLLLKEIFIKEGINCLI